jgi:surface antigen
LSLSLAVTGGAAAATVAEIAEPNPSAAMANGGYPDANAADCSALFGAYSWCKDENGNGSFNAGEQNSPRGYDYRNCTDWAAFRIPQLVQRTVPTGWSHANNWDNKARQAGITVDNTPEPGDIAVWDDGSMGHVAVVESTNPLKVSEYNKHQDGTHSTRLNPTGIDHYIDLNGTGKGINGAPIGEGGGESLPPTTARPAVAVYNDALNVFIRGGNGQIYHQYWTGNNWSGFSSLGGNMASNPTLIENQGALNIFARGIDGQIYTKYFTGSGWTDWNSMGSQTMLGNPHVTRYGDEIDVFALGTDRHPYKNTWNPANGWGGWTTLGDYMDSSPTALQYGPNLNVIMRGGNNQVYNDSWAGNNWSGFGSIGGVTSGNPDALQYGSHLNVLVNTPSNHVYMNTWNGSAWGGWADHGGNFAGDPEVMQYNNDMEFFVRGTNGRIYTRWWSASEQRWGGWNDLGGNMVSEPTAVQYNSELSVFATGADGKVHKNTFHPGSGWGGFTPLPG